MEKMDGQLSMFGNTGRQQEHGTCMDSPRPETLLWRLFGKLDNPVIRCTNCLCSYCANNAEEVYHRVKPGEMVFPCIDCDDCREYGGRSGDNRCKEDCAGFTVSAYGAGRIRRGFKVVEGGKKDVF